MKCDTKRCRNEMDLIVVGIKYCNTCWGKKCKRDEKAWEVQDGANILK
jgi:hypothetical protein